MLLTNFYRLINDELTHLLENNPTDERTKTHKNANLNKGYAMLIWFLRFYGQKELYKSYITDGKDDSSCDIIFSNKNVMGEDIFYVVQSKYVNFDSEKKKEEEFPKIDKKELGYALNDFAVMLSGERREGKNDNFNQKYEALKRHLEANGKVKFIFFTLANAFEEVEDTIRAFNKNYAPNISLEIIDCERIRRDYIEFKYKEVTTNNPLEYAYNPEDNAILLTIERVKDSKRDVFEFNGRAKAFTFLLKPKTIHELFKKYKFSLFFKNVRNPIHRSNYNQKMIDTLLKKPDSFWFFNNGVTAITKILPEVGIHAKQIEIEGLQIINGAQTVYSIYSAYENATVMQRKAMDSYAKISFRLIGSSDEEFNLQITRFTNMQNPMLDSDFWANDEVQQRLQNESFKTNTWYEKRRGEFQLDEKAQANLNIRIVEHKGFASAYAAFHLQKPTYILQALYFFVSRKEDKDGLYEEIFNEKTRFEDMYVARYLFNEIFQIINKNKAPIEGNAVTSCFVLALSKIVMEKYFSQTRPNTEGKTFNLTLHLLRVSKQDNETDKTEIRKIFKYTERFFYQKVFHNIGKNGDAFDQLLNQMNQLLNNLPFYERIAQEIEEKGIDIAEIQNIEVE